MLLVTLWIVLVTALRSPWVMATDRSKFSNRSAANPFEKSYGNTRMILWKVVVGSAFWKCKYFISVVFKSRHPVMLQLSWCVVSVVIGWSWCLKTSWWTTRLGYFSNGGVLRACLALVCHRWGIAWRIQWHHHINESCATLMLVLVEQRLISGSFFSHTFEEAAPHLSHLFFILYLRMVLFLDGSVPLLRQSWIWHVQVKKESF